ncbi:MAG TPA: hypothetical protein VHN80_03805, partial [Kineosporiaceae bacterium]|nr:hypothetical protein [Kineosporiaceae bacterium]
MNEPVEGPLNSHDTILPDSQEVLGAVLEAITVGVVVHRRDGTPLLTNSAARALLEGLPDGVLTPLAADAAQPRSGVTAATTRPIL